MGSPGDGVLRVARTVAVTAVVVGLAVAAHVAGGGRPPRALGLVGLALSVAYVCAWAARRRLSLPVLTGLLAAGQWALHHAFDLLDATCGPATAPLHAGHVAVTAGSCEPAATATGLLAGPHAAAPSWVMLAAHAAATAVCTLVLAAGERALWALCGLLAALLPALPRAAAPVAVPVRRAPDVAAAPRPRRAVLLRTSPRRGPPTASPRPWASLAA